MIRVLLVDDHPTMRRGLADLIGATADIEVCGAAEDGEEAVTLATELRPDVVLMDVSMPGINGVEAAAQVGRAAPGSRVVMLTSFARHEYVIDSLDAGAVGYLLKDAEPDELLRGIRSAAAGHAPISAQAASALVGERTRRVAAEELTPREREVLALVARGLTNGQVAGRMGISEKTVKTHLGNVFTRIGVADRVQAALWARDHDIL